MDRPTVSVNAQRLGFALCLAVSAAPTAAQPAGPADHGEEALRPVDWQPYACVDPADPSARRWHQREPCRLPMFHLPVDEALGFADPLSRSASLPPLPERERGHAMFWRLPVQPRGPHEAPRNSWR
jgi:hypothetical protein